MMSELGIKYILFDKTFVTGMIQPYNYDTRALYLLENYSLISQIYHSRYIDVYEFNNNSALDNPAYTQQGLAKVDTWFASPCSDVQILIEIKFVTLIKNDLYRILTNSIYQERTNLD